MRRRLLTCALAVVLVGCSTVMTPPVLQVPIGQAALVYADGHALHLLMVARVTDWCKAGKMSEADCTYLAAKNEQASAVDAEIRKGILSATGVIDWDRIMEYLQIIAGIAVRIGKAAL